MSRDYSVLSGETITVRRTNWKTPSFIYVALVFGVAFPIVFVTLPGMKNIPVVFAVIVGIFTLLNLRVWGLLTKVTIGPEGMIFQSPLKTYRFGWNEIQSKGMYIVSRNRKQPLPESAHYEKYYLRLKYVWISKYPHSEPGMFRFTNEFYGDFEFRAEAWELMNRYLSALHAGKQQETFAGRTPL